MSKQYIGSQEQFEDEINAHYDELERQNNQVDNRIQPDLRNESFDRWRSEVESIQLTADEHADAIFTAKMIKYNKIKNAPYWAQFETKEHEKIKQHRKCSLEETSDRQTSV